MRPGWNLAAAAVLGFGTAAWAGGPDGGRRAVPANATKPPGVSPESTVTGRQKAELARHLARESAAAWAAAPVRTTARTAGRLGERLGVRIAGATPTPLAPPAHQDVEAGGPCTPARLTPLYTSAAAFRALLDLIAGAESRVDLMMFGWDDDEAGRAAAAALIARARAGVAVRLLVDRGGLLLGAGNARLARGEATFLDALRAEPNVRLIEAPAALIRFDHRKLAVVDGRVAWTGGMILTHASATDWHNFAFLAEGPIVAEYADLFAGRWADLGGGPAPPFAASVARDVAPNAVVRLVRTDDRERSLKEAVYGAVDAARCHIYIENPYFSDQILIGKLAAARRRGVEVHAVLTLRGDVGIMNRASILAANALIRAGARVYLYPKMTHVKAMSVDGTLAYIGTGNFDELSLRNNREVGLTVRGPALIRDIDDQLFRRDIADSEEVRDLLPPPRGRLALAILRLWL